MTRWMLAATAASCALLGGCQKSEAPAAVAAAVTEADASAAFDATVATWASMDAAKIKALYAPDVVGFDYAYEPLVTDRATWDKNQDAFAAAKIDKLDVTAKKIQLLGPDAFVVSSFSNATSSATPTSNGVFRCTDIYQRQADGAWLIVNENCTPPVAKPA